MDSLHHFIVPVLEVAALVFVLALGILFFTVVVMYILDVTQSEQAVRKNFPVIGRFRYVFEHIGVFFRQYFFAMDREELPFNRAQRSWVARAAKNIDATLAFGSTRPLNVPGSVLLVNSVFPKLEAEAIKSERSPITFGKGYATHPYETYSFFNISGMSFGALSAPAITALSHGAKKANIWLNTGEGALSPFHLKGGCDIIFQIGTAKYGVRDEHGQLSDEKLKELADIEQVRMFEIKLSQGAKPGKGGMLPGSKVTSVIASTRGIPEGMDSISPNRHPDINNEDDLLDMITRVRTVTGKPTGLKFVLGQSGWLDDFFKNIHDRGIESAPDFITLDSADGGTGAAPQSLLDNMGLPISASLPLLIDKLTEYGLRQRVRVIVSGKLVTPSEVASALCLGADCVNTARGFMFSLGCIQALQCNKNTCPTGITTHDPKLQKGLNPRSKSERVANYANNMMNDVAMLAHSCGVINPHMLNREHAYIVNEQGVPEPMLKRFPHAQTIAHYRLHPPACGEASA